METGKKTRGSNWMNSWWFRSVVIGLVIGVGVIDRIFWSSRIISGTWAVIKTLLTKEGGWQFIVLLALLIFREQISILLGGLSNTLGRIRKLTVGKNLTFTSEELVSALVDREVLKTIIKVAMAYDGIGDKEQLYLINRASPMKDHIQRLDDDSKLQVIEEAINMALMDDEIQNPEYSIIQDVADHYGLKSKEVDDLILKACFTRKDAIPPDLLKEKYEKEYGKLLIIK